MPSSGVKTCALDRKSTRLNSSHTIISYAVFCLKKKLALASPLAALGRWHLLRRPSHSRAQPAGRAFGARAVNVDRDADPACGQARFFDLAQDAPLLSEVPQLAHQEV